MAERNTGRQWTSQEDECLTYAVKMAGENADWKNIARLVPGRTNKACRKRWLHSLSPSIKKSAWTKEEDEKLLTLYDLHGTKWSVIARQIPGRTDDACSKRYREALNPELRKDEWTEAEDAQLLELRATLGGKWVQVGKELQRSSLGCRNRYRLLQRKKVSATRNEFFPESSSSFINLSTTHLGLSQGVSPPWEFGPQLWEIHTDLLNIDMIQGIISHPSALPPSSQSSVLPQPVEDAFHAKSAYAEPFEFGSPIQGPFATLEPHQVIEYSGGEDVSNHCMDMTNIHPESSTADTEENSHGTDAPMDIDQDEAAEPPTLPPLPPLRHDNYLNQDYTTEEPSEVTYDHDDELSSEHLISSPSPSIPTIPHPNPSTPEVVPPSTFTPASSPSPVSPNSSPPRYQSPVNSPSVAPRAPRASKRGDQEGPPPRLSSNLAASSDPTVLGYACGYPQCWISDDAEHCAQYATSKELSDHVRRDHLDEPLPNDKPYRCGLQGCCKGWKSVNGLQYHLQVSRAHFIQAITTFASADSVNPEPAPIKQSLDADSNTAPKKSKRTYPCPREDCLHIYKQMSGLRYHLSHGHLDETPAQLDSVPPTLARKVTEKMKKRMMGL